MDWLLSYFDLSGVAVGPEARVLSAVPEGAVGYGLTLDWQLYIYLALVVGIIANNYLRSLQRGGCFFSPRSLIISAISGVVLLPVVYRQVQLNHAEPTIVQLAMIFTTGLGYESLLGSVVDFRFTGQRQL
jgi:hypothetical protein